MAITPVDNRAQDSLVRQLTQMLHGQHMDGMPVSDQLRADLNASADGYDKGAARGNRDAERAAAREAEPVAENPHSDYNQKAAQTAGTYFPQETTWVPIKGGRANVTLDGTQVYDGEELGRVMEQKTADGTAYAYPKQREALISQNKLQQLPNGDWVKPMANPMAGHAGSYTPGATGQQLEMAQSAMNFTNRSSAMLPIMGMLTGGLPGLMTGFMTRNALSDVSGQLSGNMAGMDMGSLGTIDKVGGAAMLFGGGTGISFDGLQHNMKAQMNSYMREMKHDTMISMIDNTGIPIEDLIFMFMAHMSENYENKLRDKMREANIAEKMSERRDRRERAAEMQAGMIQGVAGALSPFTMGISGMIGGVAGQAIRMKAMKTNELESALNGNMKSGTALANEVQMLIQKWKQLNEMMSNLLKVMHDMAMTPIRAIR